eukprot:TRINITY_DN2588_c0_g1_i1.p1 TRINITY_DN2588_c0_g1~~TRINITY_DN2588_c0_g1_i1.p1  ORF type:complete len:491 (-),score=84.43 TRINITY_DN2588_c0_g1_i1:16-1488(-)
MTPRNIELTWSLSVGAVVGAVMRVLVEIESPPPSSILFGVPLLDSCRNTEVAESIGPFLIPAPISRAWEWFATKQAWADDLFTKLSSSDVPQKMRSQFNAGNHVIPNEATPHDVATFVRDFIVEMPDSIFSDKLHDSFGSVADVQSPTEQVSRLRELFSQLHPAYRHTLKALTLFLSDILAHSTKMSSFSIAFAFEDRYVDKLPLLLDNSRELFSPENDVTQLPWFDLSKAAASGAAPLMSFSIASSSNEAPTSALDSEAATDAPTKPPKRSRHAVGSPGEPKSSKKSGRLKRVKSEAELGDAKIRSPKTKTMTDTPSEKKKRTHTKMKSDDVRSSPRIDSGKKKRVNDDGRSESPSSSSKRTPKRRSGSDTPKSGGAPLNENLSTETIASFKVDDESAPEPPTTNGSELSAQEATQQEKGRDRPKKSKRSSDRKKSDSRALEGSEEMIRSPSPKSGSRRHDRKSKEHDSSSTSEGHTKSKPSKKNMKTL